MFDRFLRRGAEARYRRINERGGISKDGPAPSEEPLSADSVLRVLQAAGPSGPWRPTVAPTPPRCGMSRKDTSGDPDKEVA